MKTAVMKRYVLGFFLTPHGPVLIRKPRRWGGEVWNGIGGKIEAGESPIEAMVREFGEEAQVVTSAADWTELLTLSGCEYNDPAQPWEMTVFVAHSKHGTKLFEHLPMEIDEGYVSIERYVQPEMFDPTAAWLLPMCDDLRRSQLQMRMPTDDKATIADFYRRVCDRAERNMEATGMVSGAHWNAMRQEMAALGIEVDR